ncbi:hypothetical protein SEA_EASLEY_66 [Gordonia phage Easley]|uniref:Helix-turn-helix DNA binding domain protein n=1 Tax=Gordonia phage Easley TaxID=2182395 RepID=A0A2U8UNC3_9CAUD|nr:replication initiation protein [Gordonia phage Easley]AWN05090.1 hypothetical protein SEA_EASLEY_66 [Gordonia phage Easley]
MPRDHARIHVDIWGDDDWLDLSIDAQMLYLTLYTSPGLSLCGSGTWHPGRLSGRASNWTTERVEEAAAELSQGLFLLIDTDTEEFLLRSWVKHDGLWRTPNMAVSVANARGDMASRDLRGVIVHEVRKLRDREPESTSWERDAVAKMLTQKAIDPADLEPFNPDPNGGAKGASNPAAKGYSKGGVNPDPTHGVKGGSNGGPTTATTPTTATESTNVLSLDERASETEYRRIPIPDDWSPNDVHHTRFPNLDLTAEAIDFRDHAISQGRLCDRRAGWDAAFNRWCSESLKRAAKTAEASGRPKHKMRSVAEQAAQARSRDPQPARRTPTHSDPRAITG